MPTVVVNEVGDGDTEDGAVDAGVEAADAFARNDLADSVEDGALRAFGLDLGARGEGDERVGEDHGEDAPAGAGDGVENLWGVNITRVLAGRELTLSLTADIVSYGELAIGEELEYG